MKRGRRVVIRVTTAKVRFVTVRGLDIIVQVAEGRVIEYLLRSPHEPQFVTE